MTSLKITSAAFFALAILGTSAYSQNGYVKFDADSVVTGYLRYYTSTRDGQGIELWRTKKDKDPLKLKKSDIIEYAIKKDTFKVLHQYKPFQETQTYFEVVDARLKRRGKVSLYIIDNYQNPNMVSTYTGGGLVPAIIDASMGNYTYMYILEHAPTGFLRALPSKEEELKEVLLDFFPERYVIKYAELNGEIRYNDIPALVDLYNSR
jgi:hypothetical protein